MRQKLRGSVIASLMNAEMDEELDTVWAFVRNNWHNLSQQPEDIDGDMILVMCYQQAIAVVSHEGHSLEAQLNFRCLCCNKVEKHF